MDKIDKDFRMIYVKIEYLNKKKLFLLSRIYSSAEEEEKFEFWD